MSSEPYLLAPNIYLFAYQLCQKKKNGEFLGQDDEFWQECNGLLKPFDVKITDKLDADKLKKPLSRRDRAVLADKYRRAIAFPDPNLQTETPATLLSGSVQPWKIKDSYGLLFNYGYDDEQEPLPKVSLSEIKDKLRPNSILHHFQSKNPSIFLGNTVLLTAYVPTVNKQHDRDYLNDLADQCFTGLFAGEDLTLCDRGELFGNPIFAYENRSKEKGDRYLLIWLFRDEQAQTSVNDCLDSISDLLFYRTKIAKGFADSRLIYQVLNNGYETLGETLDNLDETLQNRKPDRLEPKELEDFKQKLIFLTGESLPYTRTLRLMEDFGNTIKTNLHNYRHTLKEISETLEIEPKNMGLLHEFAEDIAPYFEQQIATNFRYFADGTDLVDRAIATIRGLVEIQQAESDRKLQQQNQALQDHIQAIGVGIGAGAIAASSSTLIFEQQRMTFPILSKNPGTSPHPFVIAVLLSFTFAVGFWALAKWVLPPILRIFSQNESSDESKH
ncbi:hypothetical protein PN466_19310 [Roseofilum reptotaenium CS-1145]|uniref:Uncharacterized protein n=1 Tax=Roseofilum reptotaenium AO1-A TaxID=1925591 RepID=A0A1L9QT48_9CYAN|nr:hypothetical protein [Roseofilum reptotaenium]MDB9519097.1 hypothetical protein [Roseofilum reptotaenium CS-1145]OJJ25851.1 hypothetical protein BI308_08930 [Roseofilum reptotaenium AO1-A]